MLFDYTTLKLIWWGLIGIVLIIYGATAGFDFGVTLLLPFIKKDEERRVMLNTIAPTWDGNQTWIVFAGGALFVIWPAVYGAIFSGLYALMLFILWAFFLRPPGFDYRSKLQNNTWRRLWDWGLFISAFFPIAMFGIALGNLFVGLPLHFSAFDYRSFYDGNFFGLLHPFALLCGITSLLMACMHGAIHLARRTENPLRERFLCWHRRFTLLFLISFTTTGIWVGFFLHGYTLISSPAIPTDNPLGNVVSISVGAWGQSFLDAPWKYVAPLLVYAGLAITLLTSRMKHSAIAFWGSTLAIAGTVMCVGFTLFPFIVPSSVAPNQSFTVWNAVSAQYTLMGMFYVSVVLLIFIFIYKLFSYFTIWGKKHSLTVDDVKQNEHTFY